MRNIWRNILSSVAILVRFILFVVGMLYANQFSLLTLVGILGLGGMIYFVGKFVKRAIKN